MPATGGYIGFADDPEHLHRKLSREPLNLSGIGPGTTLLSYYGPTNEVLRTPQGRIRFLFNATPTHRERVGMFERALRQEICEMAVPLLHFRGPLGWLGIFLRSVRVHPPIRNRWVNQYGSDALDVVQRWCASACHD